MNQPLLNLFYVEMKIYENFSGKYSTYKNLEEKLSQMRTNFAQKDRRLKYDPTIFLKNPYLDSKINKGRKSTVKEVKEAKQKIVEQSKVEFKVPSPPIKTEIIIKNQINEEEKQKFEEKYNSIENFFTNNTYSREPENPFKSSGRINEKIEEEIILDKKSLMSYPTLVSVLEQQGNLPQKQKTEKIFRSAFPSPSKKSENFFPHATVEIVQHKQVNDINDIFSEVNFYDTRSKKDEISNNPKTVQTLDPFAVFY
jgi:hypothetical protein